MIFFSTFIAILLMASLPGHVGVAKTQEQPSKKEICEQAKKQAKELEKDKEDILKRRVELQRDYNQAQTTFEGLKARHGQTTGCVQGNPQGSSECETILNGLKASGDQMTNLEKQMAENTRQRISVENQLYKPTLQLKTYRCDS